MSSTFSKDHNSRPSVTVLMCTRDGERFLADQLKSIERQAHEHWRLIVSDDGSTDSTLEQIDEFAKRNAITVEVREGPRKGPPANFLSLATDPAIDSDYFAFCDQDDVWHADKLARAVAWLQSVPSNVAAIYGSRTRLIDEQGKPFGYSPLFQKTPAFANALVQSIAGANTMVFNRPAKQLLERAGPLRIVSHDWWAYQLVSGCNGMVYYDPEPTLDYRQHAGNFIGCNRGLRAQLKRSGMVLRGGFAAWNDVNFAALQKCRSLLTDESRAMLDQCMSLRTRSFPSQLWGLAMSPFRRQTFAGNLALVAAVALKRF